MNQRHLTIEIWEPSCQPRVIVQLLPAVEWVAVYWLEEDKRFLEARLIAWALVEQGGVANKDVVGIVANTVDAEHEGESPTLFADELINFRYYRYKEQCTR